jgi:hypothetical protein
LRNIEHVSPFERKHFDLSSVTIHPHHINIASLLGCSLTDLQIKGLSGALSGSSITVDFQHLGQTVGSEYIPPGLYFQVENLTYIRSRNVIGLFRDNPSGLGIYINSVDFRPGQGLRGLAARMLAVMIRHAFQVPQIKRICLLAAGGRSWPPLDPNTGERWGGFIAWPTYGFDMQIPRHTANIAPEFPYYPEEIISRQKVSEVISIAGGRDYWKIVGDGDYMDFDLSSKSTQSIVTLDSFLGKAGI